MPINIEVMALPSAPELLKPLAAQQIRQGFLLRFGRIGEHFQLRRICQASHPHAGGHIVLGGFRVTDRLDIQQRLIRRAGEHQLPFTHDQILTISMESAGRDVNLAVEAQPFLVLYHFQIALQAGLEPNASSRTSLPTWIIRLLLIGIDAVLG